MLGEITDLSERTISLLRSVAILHECTPRSLDAIVSYGEKISAPIVAALLNARGTKAQSLSAEGLLITDDSFGHANPLLDETKNRVHQDRPAAAQGRRDAGHHRATSHPPRTA